ncbi:subclass B3 metallo-beta-lactamase [Rhodanobacter sp. DHG33]|uniref:subclass B3 metallo-beta-lactamase n=1 Tax=Rhodanobacter sp. DHG33 TaxID=2775921 RepID=UPI001780CD67|nr:subclass B3 metallo-beta-lactamase [Rhodanobacter sp. DHG33]MBD8899354.1 subclass B3 metallo-beta-lactamase [Rhodanobacter sp. DHG33]
MKSPLRTTLLTIFAMLPLYGALAETPAWTQPQQPFRIYGNTYYVGTRGLSSIMIASSQGLVLIDGTLPQNAAQVEANIMALGFDIADVKWIINSHAHFDHAGAIAQLARDSGARVAASSAGAKALMLGGKDPDDPQYGEAPAFAPIAKVTPVPDHGVVRLGDVTVTAHYTPGHTPGATTWTWRSCQAGLCMNIVYADSLGAFAADGYRFSDPEHPQRLENYRRSIATIASLPCDILLSPHPDQAAHFLERVAQRDAGAKPDPVIDGHACRTYAEEGRVKLETRLAKEKGMETGGGAHATP